MEVTRQRAYGCPIDKSALDRSDDGYTCETCGRRFDLEHEVALLDVVHSPEALVFDSFYAPRDAFDDARRAESVALVDRFLSVLGESAVERSGRTIVEIACGDGALTYGLAATERLRDCDVYAFDHSVAGLRILARSLADGTVANNRIHLSAQDVYRMAFAAQSADIVFGSAVLHHFGRIADVFAEVASILKPDGVAVFAEPFSMGYVFPVTLLVLASRRTGIALDAPDTGLARFIVDDIAFRSIHADDPEALAVLSDKHLFREETLVATAREAGFDVRSVAYEAPDFYEHYMRIFLDSYGIAQPELRAAVLDDYAAVRAHFGPAFPDLFGHYKFIVMTKHRERHS